LFFVDLSNSRLGRGNFRECRKFFLFLSARYLHTSSVRCADNMQIRMIWMPIKFNLRYAISPRIASDLMRIEGIKASVEHMPLTVLVLSSLRETARLCSIHYSTQIEGNQLKIDQVEAVLTDGKAVAGRARDEAEVKGYYAALTRVERWAYSQEPLTERLIQQIHALVMSGVMRGDEGRKSIKPTPYRDGQNVIRDAQTRQIVYLPPEASDVFGLMRSLIAWIKENETVLPIPIVAAIAHYQYVTIHPYYDGNGRTARLLATFILHRGGYDLKGIYSLEEYYARNLEAYYTALTVGASHNYYLGRAEADITAWIEYFIEGMANACEKVLKQMERVALSDIPDQSPLLRTLDPKQRKALELFRSSTEITARQIGQLFDFKPRTSAQLCQKWVKLGFLEIANPTNRNRSYRLSAEFKNLVEVAVTDTRGRGPLTP